MTQSEKEFLFKDLSARLLYGVRVNYKEDRYDFHHWTIDTLYKPQFSQDGTLINTSHDGWIGFTEYPGCGMSSGSRPLKLGEMLPYLRPMSSMTEEERKEYKHLVAFSGSPDGVANFVDWLNKKMFAYRTLDGKDMFVLGLAVEAEKGMYK